MVGLTPVPASLGDRLTPALRDRRLARGDVDVQQHPSHGSPFAQADPRGSVHGQKVAVLGSRNRRAHAPSADRRFWRHPRAVGAVLLGPAAGATRR